MLSLYVAMPAQALDWPQFHGPNRDNISRETGLLKAWPEGGPKLLWTAKGLGEGYSSVSTAHGMVYTAGNVGEDTVITAMDLSGKVLWIAKNGRAWLKSYSGTRGTPTIDGDRLYHESALGNIICVEAKTGKVIWELNIIEKFKGDNPNWAMSESLLIHDDKVICCPGGKETAMVALNKFTGEVLWKALSAQAKAGYASPVVAEHEGLTMIITMTTRGIIGVHAQTGALLWNVPHKTMAYENILTPIVHDGQVFVSTQKTGAVKWEITVDGQTATLTELWRSKQMDNHHGGVILLDGYLYGNSTYKNNKRWVCLDWETGAPQYIDKGLGKGALIYADGMLYILTTDRTLGLVHADPKAHEIVSTFEIPDDGKGKTWAHPVVSNGRLYIRHGNFLHAYDVAFP
jgi:outer membrane protein assembly factor BamB